MVNLTTTVPLLSQEEQSVLEPALTDIVEYRKSGLSLNHVIGCTADCGYCVRHLFGNFAMKEPAGLMTDEDAVEMLVSHPYFQRDVTPIQFFNRATDPMLAPVKPHAYRVLKGLDDRELTNHVLVITRMKVDDNDCEFFNALKHIKLTLLFTHSGIDDKRIEPFPSKVAAKSMARAFARAGRYRVIQYWRPVVPGLNDSDIHIARARELAEHAHATVFTGLFYRKEIQAYYIENGLPEPYADTARRKIFPETLEQRILDAFRNADGTHDRLFRKTSCGVAYAHSLPDYNGHYGIREVCDICPLGQIKLCAQALTKPDRDLASTMALDLGGELVEINDRAIVVRGLSEQPRYLMQHSFGYQVHDVDKPHRYRQHGRADIGWPTPLTEPAGV